MPTYTYTGVIGDVSQTSMASRRVRLLVRPAREVFGPDGLIPAAAIDVPVNQTSGAFSMQLVASPEMVTPTAYVLEVGWFEQTMTGERFHSTDTFYFFAAVGGGRVVDMVSALVGGALWWEGVVPPPNPKPGMHWLNPDTGDVQVWEV